MHLVTLCVTSERGAFVAALPRRAWERSGILFPFTHQLVTERPSVAQNHAFVTISNPLPQDPRKISSTPEPSIPARSSPVRDFSWTTLQQVGRL